MSSVPRPSSQSSAQVAAEVQARAVADAVSQQRQAYGALVRSRGGMCMASGWNVSYDSLDGDFSLDAPTVQRLLDTAAQAGGPSMRAAPAPGALGPSPLQEYLFPPPASAPPGSLGRLGEETGGAVWGPGNVLANSSSALAGALQGLGERSSAQALAGGIADILAGRVQRVRIGAHLELYNAAQGRQRPRVRLHVRGLPIKVVTQAIPASGGPVTQWRVNGPGTAASLKAGSMTAQQLRNTAVLAGERGLPSALRWASGKVGGGVLTFAPSLALDAYDAVEVDLETGARSFNTRKFLVAEAKSQSGNAVGFAGALGVTAVAGLFVAGAPLVLIGLAGGIAFQVMWNWSGWADDTAGAVQQALN